MPHFSSSPRQRTLLTATAVLFGALTLAACTPAEPTASSSDSSSSSQSSPETSTPSESSSPSGSATPSSTGSASSSPSSSASSAAPSSNPPTPAAPAICTAGMLSGSIDESGGAGAGSVFLHLVVKNKTTKPCSINGYPGVSLVGNNNGTQLGAAADRNPADPSQGAVLLAPGASASAQLQYTHAENYGAGCSISTADGFRVYPPSATDALYIAHPIKACSQQNIVLLHIGTFKKA